MDIITKFDRIEDILGSPDGRYFGNGYTQVKYFQKVKHITFEGIDSIFFLVDQLSEELVN